MGVHTSSYSVKFIELSCFDKGNFAANWRARVGNTPASTIKYALYVSQDKNFISSASSKFFETTGNASAQLADFEIGVIGVNWRW